MRPLEPLQGISTIEHALRALPVADARAEIERAAAQAKDPAAVAAVLFARGALALRSGALADARVALQAAASAFGVIGEVQAARLAECEAHVAIFRLDRNELAASIAVLRLIAERATDDLVFVTASIICGAAHVAAAEPESALEALAAALARSEGLPYERIRLLNSLGTLYAALGSDSAAQGVLEHAAELAHRRGATESEAIAHGQLGAIALARGQLDRARKHLGAQELLATKIGDPLGRARALAYLAEVALIAGQPDAAREIAARGRAVAETATPALTMFAAFSERIERRASADLGVPIDRPGLDALYERFIAFGRANGAALVAWDIARAGGADAPAFRARSIAAFARLGLGGRVAEVLLDTTERTAQDELTIAALAQAHPYLAAAHESSLVFSNPAALAAIGSRRIAGERNLARLAYLVTSRSGLVVAACIAEGPIALPSVTSQGALVCAIDDAAVWAWESAKSDDDVRSDLAHLANVRAAVQRAPIAHLKSVPFPGEPGPGLEGIVLSDLIVRARALAPGTIDFSA